MTAKGAANDPRRIDNLAKTTHTCDYDPRSDRVGLQAAAAPGVAPSRMLKTLMAVVDGKTVCAVLRSDREVSMKALAASFGGKSARMMAPADAERMTGYRVGGISPFGQKRPAPTVIDASALLEELVFVNGGQRGQQIEAAPRELAAVLGAQGSDITA